MVLLSYPDFMSALIAVEMPEEPDIRTVHFFRASDQLEAVFLSSFHFASSDSHA
jgi:hypothetical protein